MTGFALRQFLRLIRQTIQILFSPLEGIVSLDAVVASCWGSIEPGHGWHQCYSSSVMLSSLHPVVSLNVAEETGDRKGRRSLKKPRRASVRPVWLDKKAWRVEINKTTIFWQFNAYQVYGDGTLWLVNKWAPSEVCCKINAANIAKGLFRRSRNTGRAHRHGSGTECKKQRLVHKKWEKFPWKQGYDP